MAPIAGPTRCCCGLCSGAPGPRMGAGRDVRRRTIMGATARNLSPAGGPLPLARLARAAAVLGCLDALGLACVPQHASAQADLRSPRPDGPLGPRLKRVLADGRVVGRERDMNRFRIKIDPKTPLAELLPEPP